MSVLKPLFCNEPCGLQLAVREVRGQFRKRVCGQGHIVFTNGDERTSKIEYSRNERQLKAVNKKRRAEGQIMQSNGTTEVSWFERTPIPKASNIELLQRIEKLSSEAEREAERNSASDVNEPDEVPELFKALGQPLKTGHYVTTSPHGGKIYLMPGTSHKVQRKTKANNENPLHDFGNPGLRRHHG